MRMRQCHNASNLISFGQIDGGESLRVHRLITLKKHPTLHGLIRRGNGRVHAHMISLRSGKAEIFKCKNKL